MKKNRTPHNRTRIYPLVFVACALITSAPRLFGAEAESRLGEPQLPADIIKFVILPYLAGSVTSPQDVQGIVGLLISRHANVDEARKLLPFMIPAMRQQFESAPDNFGFARDFVTNVIQGVARKREELYHIATPANEVTEKINSALLSILRELMKMNIKPSPGFAEEALKYASVDSLKMLLQDPASRSVFLEYYEGTRPGSYRPTAIRPIETALYYYRPESEDIINAIARTYGMTEFLGEFPHWWNMQPIDSNIAQILLKYAMNLNQDKIDEFDYVINFLSYTAEGSLDAHMLNTIRDRAGNTPLMRIIQDLNDLRLVNILLDQGADKSAENLRGETAQKLAEQKGNVQILKSLATRVRKPISAAH